MPWMADMTTRHPAATTTRVSVWTDVASDHWEVEVLQFDAGSKIVEHHSTVVPSRWSAADLLLAEVDGIAS